MLKKLKASALLIIIGEILSWILNYFDGNDYTSFSEFTTGLLLGISVGIKLVGIILLVYSIVRSGKEDGKQQIEENKKLN